MEQLPGNSHRSQTQASAPAEEPKKIEKIVKGEVTTRKKPFLRRLGDNLMVNRADVVGAAVFWEVLLPAAKNTFVDAVNTYANRLVGTDISGRSHGSIVGQVLNQSVGMYNQQQQFNYNRVGQPIPGQGMPVGPQISRQARARHDFKEILIPTRVEAEEVIAGLLWHIEQYNAVTVSDFYQMCGITPDYTDDNYGWTDIRGAGVLYRGGRYVIDLPRPVPLD